MAWITLIAVWTLTDGCALVGRAGYMGCPDANTIVAFLDGKLVEPERSLVATHLDSCGPCFDLVAAGVGPVMEPVPFRAPAAALSKGAVVGRYLILELVGRGGMGDVYAAYDPKLDRRIALKLLNERATSPASVARFSREAQAIARLTHPNVIAIHDAGEFDNRRFLAMEFVEGQTLAEWLRSEARSWRQIRDVFAAAGAGLVAAHEAGLVHRDFKPQNVMVGRDGSVRVTDFGLAADVSEIESGDTDPIDLGGASAERTAQTIALTKSGVLLGTPLYMAPEQFRGEATDARTDQFSFCVALYEALYGEHPFPSTSMTTLFEAVVAGRVREPTQKARLPGFLRKLLLRGIAADPASRFPSMRALLERLRYNPVRRHKALSLGAVVLLCVFAVAWGGERWAAREQRICYAAEDRLEGIWELREHGPRRDAIHQAFLGTGRGFAENTWVRVAAILDDYSRRWNETYVDACAATHVRRDQSPAVLELRAACLEGPRGALRALTNVLSRPDSTVLVEAAKAAQALPPIERCSDVAALEAVVPEPTDAAARARASALRTALANVKALTDTGQWPEARSRVEPLVDAARAIGYKPLLAEALAARAWLEQESGASATAAEIYEKAVWTALAAHRDDLAVESAAALVGITGYYLARPHDSERWAVIAQALLERLGPGHDRVAAWFYQDRAVAAERRGDNEAAIADLERALSLKKKVLPPDHPDIALTLIGIAATRIDMGQNQAAFVAADAALKIYQNAYGPESSLMGHPLGERGEALGLLGRYAEAERDLRSAVRLFSEWVGADHPWTAYQLTALGKTLIAEGGAREALAVLKHALRIRESSEPNADLVAETRFALARATWDLGQDRAAAESLARSARDTYRARSGHDREIDAIDTWLADRSRGRPRLPARPVVR